MHQKKKGTATFVTTSKEVEVRFTVGPSPVLEIKFSQRSQGGPRIQL